MNPDLEDIKDRILEFCTHFRFDFCGKDCGVDPFNKKYFHLWCDRKTLEVHSIEEVFNTPFFCGKALKDIVDEIEITEW